MFTKTKIRSIAKVLLFIFLFLTIFDYTSNVLVNKNASAALSLIEEKPSNYYDVILAGPSHMQYALQPAQLFGEHGIISCNTATAAQSIPTSYYIIKEMIERHTPKLVVIDLFCLFYPDVFFTNTRFHQAMDPFPISKNKIVAIQDLVDENHAEFYVNYLLYHERWKELAKEDYTIYKTTNETYQLLFGIEEQITETFTPIPQNQKTKIPDIPHKYLKKIVDLCKKTNTELLLTVIPYKADVDNNNTSAILQQQMYNTVKDLATQWDVDFFNALYYMDDIGINLTTDMIEFSHVNAAGAQKISKYYGRYFIENYEIPDHSTDPKYSDWYDDYKKYSSLLDNTH